MDQEIKTVIQYPTGSTEFDIPFDYLSRKFVRVSLVTDDNRRLLSNITEYRYVSKTRVKVLVDTTGFDRVEIRRFTSASERVVDFSDGSVLRANDLNVSQLQSAHIAEEARDAALLAMPEDDAGNLDARNRKIVRLAPGIYGTDAINKNQLDTTLGEAGGILSDMMDLEGELHDYIEKFADDTALVRGVAWVYNSGSANGGESVITIDKPTRTYAVPYVVINGLRQEVGYHYQFDINTQSISLVKPLEKGDFLVAITTESNIPLESMLASAAGSSSVGKLGGGTVQDFITNTESKIGSFSILEDFGPVGTPEDTATTLLSALSSGKPIVLTRMYSLPMRTFSLPSGTTLVGLGTKTGFEAAGGTDLSVNLLEVGGTDVLLSNFAITMDAAGRGSVGRVACYGVHFLASSSGNRAQGLKITGKVAGSTVGFTHGVRCNGVRNVVDKCDIQYCSMGITLRGEYHKITNNYLNNHFVDENLGPWTSASMFWDGITGEGCINCEISGNISEYNGQSGIYFGGNNSLSQGLIITNNICRYNYNRGIDTGISGSKSTSNDVTNLIISNNYIRNNRETQLWLYGTSNTQLLGNKIIETDEYDTLFGSQPSTSRAGLALGQTAWCVSNIIDNNDIQVRTTTPFGVVFNGSGHIISQNNRIGGGAPNYWFGSPVNMVYSNKVAYFKATFTPVLRAGSSGVTLTSGTASYTIRNNEVEYDIELLMNASTGIGNLYVGTLPATNGVLLDSQEVIVTYWTGLTWAMIPGSQLQAYFLIDDPAQIAIVRKYGSDTINDVPSCIGVGTRLRIKARAVVNTTTKTNSATGISFFGHSFLSEQGFANGVAESLGKRCYNFARGGSSSAETARVFGAVVGNYMPVGGTIPASGSVDLTPNEDSVWYAGGGLATVSLAGVVGTISSTTVSGTTTRLTFTRSTAGTAVSVPSAVPMTVLPYVRQNSWSTKSLTEHSTFKDDIVVIQCMRNNSSWAQGLTDVAAIVSSLGTNKFVILPEFPYATETTGTAGATTVSNYNAQLKAAYPNNYCQINGVDLLDNFKNNYNPDYAQDVTDIANGVTPSSLRYDTLHPSRYRQANALRSGVQVNAEFVAKFIKSKGW